MLMEMASFEVEMSSCQTFNCVMSHHERCIREDNNEKTQNNSNVRSIHVGFEKNLNVFARDHLDNCTVSVENGDDSTKSVLECSSNKSSVSDHRLSKTEDSRHDVPSSSSLGSETDPNISYTGQPENLLRNETMAASSLFQIWEARTTQQPPSSNQIQSQIDSRTSSSGSNLLENSESLNEESVKESKSIQPIEEGNNEDNEEMECDSPFVPPPDSGEREREGVRVMDIIRKLSNDPESITNNDSGSSSSNENCKEVQTTEARCFPQVACPPRIRGRQAFADLLVQMTRDREKELACLLDRHTVSKFTHRGRIQSTLRIRCYERCIAIQDRHRCKSSSAGSDLNRSQRGSGVMHLLREKYKTNSERIETGTSTSSVSSQGRLLDKDPHKAAEKKVLQETMEKSDLKESQEVKSAVETKKKAVLSVITENKNGLMKSDGETIQKETTEVRDEKQELAKEKAIANESVEGSSLVRIAEKVNLWNSEEKTTRIRGMEKGNTVRVDVLEEATRRTINVESSERSITTSRETMMTRCEFAEKGRRKKKEDSVSVETKSREIEDRISNPQEITAQSDGCLRKPEESEEEEKTLMGIAEKVNLWNSKEKKNRRRVMEKGNCKTEDRDNTETNQVLKEASRRILNVETAERSNASSKETMEKVVGTREMMDRRKSSREATRSESAEIGRKKVEVFTFVESKSKEIIEDKNMDTQPDNSNKDKNSSQHSEDMPMLQNSEAKFTKEIDRKNSQKVTEESVSGERAQEKNSPQQDEMSILRNPNDLKDIKESEDEETNKVEREEEGETMKESLVESVNDLDENEMEEEEEDVDYDHYNGENMDDWINEISRPRSYWEDLRKERYLEVLNTESEKKDICNLIERRTVSNFLTSDLRQKIDNLMMIRTQDHLGVQINLKEEDDDEEEEVEEEEECSARNQEDNETEEEPEKTNLEGASDVCSQTSARSSTMMSWSFRDRDIGKDHELTTSLSLPEPLVPTNQSTQEMQMIIDLRGEMKQIQLEMLELRNSVKSCIDMQLHFQKSLTQDLSRPGSSEEKRVDTKKDLLKRKCCVCSENPVDSLLYRCGHMCTCLKCGHELQWSSKKCPICMAPIVDVVRAFLDS